MSKVFQKAILYPLPCDIKAAPSGGQNKRHLFSWGVEFIVLSSEEAAFPRTARGPFNNYLSKVK